MKKQIFAFTMVFFSGLLLFAQKPTPTPSDDDSVVKISTTLIQIDVSVTDKKGKQITDLKPEDFEVFENGELQEITNFSYIAVTPDVSEQQNQVTVNSRAVKIPPVPTRLRSDQLKRTIVLIINDIGMSFSSFYYVREAMKKFVNEQMQEGDLAAIIRTSSGASVFQQLTSDKRILRAAIDRIKWNGLTGRIGLFDPLKPSTKELTNGTVRSDGSVRQTQGDEQDKEFEEDNKQMQEGIFASGALGAISYVVQGMSEMPGRKSIILFSDGLPAMFDADVSNRNPASNIVFQALTNLVETANRAGVVINTVDARGLVVAGMMTAEDDTTGKTIEQIDEIQRQRILAFGTSQMGLSYLSSRTGGRNFMNQNNLSAAVEKVLEEQKGYYLIAYQPDSDTFDKQKRRFNKLEVRVKREGAQVSHRSGFFSVTDENIRAARNRQASQTPQQKMIAALFSPFGANGINLRITSIFANDAKEGNFVRTLLHLNGKDIAFSDIEDGNKKMSFEVIGYTFDLTGAIADRFSKVYTISVKPEIVPRIIEKGLVYSMIFPVKKAGAYQFRVAVRDVNNDKIGAATQFIEVPNLEKHNLTLSGLILQQMTAEQWQEMIGGKNVSAEIQDAQTVTATRIFRRGSVLLYNYVVYNAKTDSNRNVQVQTQARLYRDGQLVFEGKLLLLDAAGQTDLQRLEGKGAVMLGKNLAPGDYVLQIIAIDPQAKEKNQIQAQFIDFELTE